MIKEAFCVIFAACVLSRVETAEAKKLPNLLLIDDTSREILFLDLYKRLSALEARTQMSDAVDWTQQTQFDTLKTLAENQQKWLKDVEALLTLNDRCNGRGKTTTGAAWRGMRMLTYILLIANLNIAQIDRSILSRCNN